MANGQMGVSFVPTQQNLAQGGQRSMTPIQQAIKFLSMKLPTRISGAPAPSALLTAAGGAGMTDPASLAGILAGRPSQGPSSGPMAPSVPSTGIAPPKVGYAPDTAPVVGGADQPMPPVIPPGAPANTGIRQVTMPGPVAGSGNPGTSVPPAQTSAQTPAPRNTPRVEYPQTDPVMPSLANDVVARPLPSNAPVPPRDMTPSVAPEAPLQRVEIESASQAQPAPQMSPVVQELLDRLRSRYGQQQR